ncbi:MAG: KTSC domain-containing protein [Halofilum sp. (in: g-proteobacteria)]
MHSPIVHQPHRKPDHVCVRMQPVESQSIRRLGYNADSQQLVIHFYDSLPGLRTVYAPVPSEIYEQLCASDAMGRYVDEHIRYAYDFALVKEEALIDPDGAREAGTG